MRKNTFSKYILIVAALMLSSLGSFAQTVQQIEQITKNYNTSFLQSFAQESLAKSTLELEEAIQHAKANNLPVVFHTEPAAYFSTFGFCQR